MEKACWNFLFLPFRRSSNIANLYRLLVLADLENQQRLKGDVIRKLRNNRSGDPCHRVRFRICLMLLVNCCILSPEFLPYALLLLCGRRATHCGSWPNCRRALADKLFVAHDSKNFGCYFAWNGFDDAPTVNLTSSNFTFVVAR